MSDYVACLVLLERWKYFIIHVIRNVDAHITQKTSHVGTMLVNESILEKISKYDACQEFAR